VRGGRLQFSTPVFANQQEYEYKASVVAENALLGSQIKAKTDRCR